MVAGILLAIYLILTGLSLLALIAVSNTVLGILALIAGILFLVESIHPITVFRRRD